MFKLKLSPINIPHNVKVADGTAEIKFPGDSGDIALNGVFKVHEDGDHRCVDITANGAIDHDTVTTDVSVDLADADEAKVATLKSSVTVAVPFAKGQAYVEVNVGSDLATAVTSSYTGTVSSNVALADSSPVAAVTGKPNLLKITRADSTTAVVANVSFSEITVATGTLVNPLVSGTVKIKKDPTLLAVNASSAWCHLADHKAPEEHFDLRTVDPHFVCYTLA